MRHLYVLLALVVSASGLAQPTQPSASVQPYSATLWTTTTLVRPSGSSPIFTERSQVIRNSDGSWWIGMYRSTQGVNQDVTAPLDQVLTAPPSPQTSPAFQLTTDKLVEEDDLGNQTFFGQAATGKRQTFQSTDQSIKTRKTQETWYSPALRLVVHAEIHDYNGITIVRDLGDLQLGQAAIPANPSIPPTAVPSTLTLYRALFGHIAQLEKIKAANSSAPGPNVAVIEANIRKDIGITADQWPALVAAAVSVNAYSDDATKQARALAEHDRSLRRQSPLTANTVEATREALHDMQLNLNARISADIDGFETTLGPTATAQIHNYLNGHVAATAVPVHLRKLSGGAQ